VNLTNVHAPELCAGRHCIIHNPSDNHMSKWPKVWRQYKGLFERTCPHGIGHPDVDDVAYHVSAGTGGNTVHGCDGCCIPPRIPRQRS
jgi:hypothetical protein